MNKYIFGLLFGMCAAVSAQDSGKYPYLEFEDGQVIVKYANSREEIPKRELRPSSTPFFSIDNVTIIQTASGIVDVHFTNAQR